MKNAFAASGVLALILALASLSRAQVVPVVATPEISRPAPSPFTPLFEPVKLVALPDDQSIYAPPSLPRDDEGVNAGGVNIDVNIRYMTDYVYRGIDFSEVGGNEDSPNLQLDGRISFNLGKFPHPFVGAFVNVYDSDPISRFQEIRPYFGASWRLRPFEFEAGNITYIYPERDETNTGEVYGKVTFDDSWLFQTKRPILAPYVMAAYDYDRYNGWYVEAGLRHDLVIENTGLTLSFVGNLSYVLNHGQFALTPKGNDTGLQHYQLGVLGSYSLNRLFGFSARYGTWSLEGYLYYTDKTSSDLRGDTQIWGGAGIRFSY